MRKNKRGFSIVFTMIFVAFIALVVISILEYMIPFSRDTKGIENSSASFYEALKGIEDGLFYAKENKLKDKLLTTVGKSKYILIANSSFIPFSGKGNSDYDKDFNIIKAGKSVQLEIGNNVITNWSGVKLYIKVPTIIGGTTLKKSTAILVSWRLSSANDSLSSTLDSSITATNIVDNTLINNLTSNNNMSLLKGVKLDGISQTLSSFYISNCGTGHKCSLKLSVINDLLSTAGGGILPYLEWKINFGTNVVPTRFFRISSSGRVVNFKKTLEIQRPQQTVLQGFDFTVIQ